MSIKEFSTKHLPSLYEEMTDFLKVNNSEEMLLESMIYSLEAGGKRLRPLLFLATLDFFDVEIKKGHYQVAAALEMIHTYSLIHDDLPAMDNDDLRRGKPTNHKVFGEALAILAGDGLLTEALHLASVSDLSDSDRVWVMSKLAKAAGTLGMIGGQVGDIQGEKKQLALGELQSVHRRKTGALIEFAVECGCYLSRQTEEVTNHMMAYADNFGVAFQIKDDLLDVLGDEKELGKKTGMDAALNKSTYTSLLGVEGAEEALATHFTKAMSSLECVKANRTEKHESILLEELIQTLMG